MHLALSRDCSIIFNVTLEEYSRESIMVSVFPFFPGDTEWIQAKKGIQLNSKSQFAHNTKENIEWPQPFGTKMPTPKKDAI